MKTYVFYASDIAVNVYEKNALSAITVNRMREEGFRLLPFEACAKDEAQATDQMLAHFKENRQVLKTFINDQVVPEVLFGLLTAH